ncbi:MAG: hypothetical protein MK008_12035 [Bdellovibrionales bacterium]|nr:hypothetical protein [Bdellovibrionales bacterium]
MIKAKYIVCGVSDEGTVIMGLSSENVDDKYMNLKIIHQTELEQKEKRKTKFEKLKNRLFKRHMDKKKVIEVEQDED